MKTSELLPPDRRAMQLFFWRERFAREFMRYLNDDFDQGWALAEACIEYFDENTPPSDALF